MMLNVHTNLKVGLAQLYHFFIGVLQERLDKVSLIQYILFIFILNYNILYH